MTQDQLNSFQKDINHGRLHRMQAPIYYLPHALSLRNDRCLPHAFSVAPCTASLRFYARPI